MATTLKFTLNSASISPTGKREMCLLGIIPIFNGVNKKNQTLMASSFKQVFSPFIHCVYPVSVDSKSPVAKTATSTVVNWSASSPIACLMRFAVSVWKTSVSTLAPSTYASVENTSVSAAKKSKPHVRAP